MNVAEYIVKYLEEKEIDKVFGVVGGAALWFCKALGESSYIQPIFTNHEQSAAMAADGWARIAKKPGIVFTINGPGMTNTVTGIAQAWTDSSPVILITGGSNLDSIEYERKNGVRQYGTQDVDVQQIMKGITKKTILVRDPNLIAQYMNEAFETAITGRPGPVCLEVPINIQSAKVEEVVLFDQNNEIEEKINVNSDQIKAIAQKLVSARKPLILAGQGVRLSDCVEDFRRFVEKYQIPVVNSRMGIDTIESDSRFFVGRAGNHGSRAAHFAIETCDVLLILGSRMAPNTTGYDVSKFSNQSYKILVDIEEKELNKYALTIDEKICMDVYDFIKELETYPVEINNKERDMWIACCADWRYRYPIMQSCYYDNEGISTYAVVDTISKQARTDEKVLSDTGSCCSIVAQTWEIKKDQRLFISGGLSAMGYWATAMGVALANKERCICFSGDGSLQMNIQELATIRKYNIPMKLFVINNAGYQFVRMSQSAYGINPPVGTNVMENGGVPIPDTKKIVEAYELNYTMCNKKEDLEETVKKVLETPDPEVCEIFVAYDQEVCPRLKSVALEDGTFVSPEYANLYPFLDREVLQRELGKGSDIR